MAAGAAILQKTAHGCDVRIGVVNRFSAAFSTSWKRRPCLYNAGFWRLVENKTSAKSDADVTAWRDGPDRGESHHSRARGDAVPGRRWSWPISRVLSWAAIHLGRRSPVASSSLPAGSADRRCQKTRLPIWPCSGWGLPCRPCCHVRGELLPRRFTLT